MRPDHLQDLAFQLELAETEPVQCLASLPPRHSKTETFLHAIGRYLGRHPERTVTYVTYADRLTKSKSRFARQYARQAGLVLAHDAQNLNEWRTPQGGGALFTSIGGALTGTGCDLLLIDDPHKDRAEAESQVLRDQVYDWYSGTAFNRVEPGGSIFICHTRWHPDDLIGRLILQEDASDWKTVFLPAILPDGSALWPERWSLEILRKRQRGMTEYDWNSLFMGNPQPRGLAVFRGSYFYTELPRRLKIGIGLDLASTAKTSSDYCVAVVLGQDLDNPSNFYLLDVRRAQATMPQFARTHMREVRDGNAGARWRWSTGGNELGLADLLRELNGFPVYPETATADKFIRAQPVAAAWNDGRILIPRGAPWAAALVSELMVFTGKKDRHDDQVDALSDAYDCLTKGTLGNLPTPKGPPIRTKFQDYGGGGWTY